MYGTEKEPNPQAGRIYDSEGISPTMDSCNGGNRMPKVLIRNATKKGYLEAYEGDGVDISSRMQHHRGTVQKESIQTLDTQCTIGVVLKSKCKRLESLVEKTEFEKGKVLNMDLYNQKTNENVSQTLTDPCHNTQRLFDGLRIRKLTPKECWRLMGFDDDDFDKAAKVNSNTQLYKQAGNSICVPVLEAILNNLLFDNR
jgi:DNA (cytosine-5)-methyltransferase 1